MCLTEDKNRSKISFQELPFFVRLLITPQDQSSLKQVNILAGEFRKKAFLEYKNID